jgi:membrane-bound lytic murein transglycosylase A
MVRLTPGEYPDFSDLLSTNQVARDRLVQAVEKSRDYLDKLPAERRMDYGVDTYSVGHLRRTLEVFLSFVAQYPSGEQLNTMIAQNFTVYRSAGRTGSGDVLFTGYYEPLLEGRRVPSEAFSVPVHPRPSDLLEIDLSLFDAELAGRRIVGRQQGNAVVPYFDRNQIRRRTDFNSLAPPIVWLRDEVDLFILQVQGSGRVDLGDGFHLRVQFAGSNGLTYRSVGRMLIHSGKISAADMSMQAIRQYLRAHPEETASILGHNPRYIFFREGSGPPLGALGFALTPMRSIAVDHKVFPSAALTFITTDLADVREDGAISAWSPYRGFALAQDAGSAITGAGRVDLFWGHGVRAEVGAGHLKHTGELYFLVLNPEDRP